MISCPTRYTTDPLETNLWRQSVALLLATKYIHNNQTSGQRILTKGRIAVGQIFNGDSVI